MSSVRVENPDLIPFHQSREERRDRTRYVNALLDAFSNLPASNGHTNEGDGASSEITIFVPSQNVSQKLEATLRRIAPEEIQVLERSGCQCDDWSDVLLMFFASQDELNPKTGAGNGNFAVIPKLRSQIRNCTFSGNVILGIDLSSTNTSASTSSSGVDILQPGIQSNTMISNSIIEPGAKVYNNSIIANTFIGSAATVLNCGSITYNAKTKEFNGVMTIDLGPESGGGRPVEVIPESTLVDVCSSLSVSHNLEDDHEKVFTMDPIEMSSNIILGDVSHSSSICNVYLSHGAHIQSSSLKDAILLPQSSIQNSIAEDVFLQWKSAIVNHSTVSSTLLMECSEIGPNSVVAHTVLGPDSHVSCGEVHCSVIGPNTNSHHQSLLISVLWPTGRGNVGYGSNCGSNHTGRIPDQECTVGEGVFWGLGCVIKFPVDLSRSYYSVIAAGVELPPQSVAVPFSLIMAGSKSGEYSGKNEIVPGWLLQSSPYTILRSEEKFKSRRKARRHDFYCGWKIIRPSVVDSCRRTRNLLLSVRSWSTTASPPGESSDSSPSNALFTGKDMTQLGQNYMTTRGLNVGIDAYTNMIQRYGLGGLYEYFSMGARFEAIQTAYQNATASQNGSDLVSSKTQADGISWPILPWEEESHNSTTKLLQHKLQTLSLEVAYIIDTDPSTLSFADLCIRCLKKLIEIEDRHAKQVLKSKQRDDKRGQQTIPGYADCHVSAENDPIVLLAQKNAKGIISKCNDFILHLSEMSSKL